MKCIALCNCKLLSLLLLRSLQYIDGLIAMLWLCEKRGNTCEDDSKSLLSQHHDVYV